MKRYLLFVCLAALTAIVPSAKAYAQQDSAATIPPVDLSKVEIVKMGEDTIFFTPEELGDTTQGPTRPGMRRINYNDTEETESFGYKYMIYKYWSVNSEGKPVELSSLMAWPIGKDLNPIKGMSRLSITEANNVIIACHVTIASNKECPSKWPDTGFIDGLTNDVRMYVGHAGGGLNRNAGSKNPIYWNLVIIPDYEGYGETSTHTHPYLDQELTARQVIDGVRAGLETWNKLSVYKGKNVHIPVYGDYLIYQSGDRPALRDGWKSIVVGYSQGGAVAMAVHRLIEQEGLADELHFGGSVCGDGPYDILATMQEYINWDRVYYPVAAALILNGMVECSPYMVHHTINDYLSTNFTKCGIMDWIKSKDYTTNDIRDKLYSYYKPGSGQPIVDTNDTQHGDNLYYMRMQDLLTPEAYSFCKSFSYPSGQWYGTAEGKFGDLQRAFENNSVLRGWQPQHPMYLLHSINDHVVPYVNAEKALQAFGNNSNFHLYSYGSEKTPRYDADLDKYGHNATGIKFLLDYTSYAAGKTGKSFEEEAIMAITNISGYSSPINSDSDWKRVK